MDKAVVEYGLVKPCFGRAGKSCQALNSVKLRACPDLSSFEGREDQPFSIAWPKADLQKPTLFGPLVRLGKNTNQHRGQGLVHQDEMSFFAAAQSRELDWNKHGALCSRCFSERAGWLFESGKPGRAIILSPKGSASPKQGMPPA